MSIISYKLQDLATKVAHQFLLSAVGPRPIAFASTVDKEGNPNLSPFSYFNVFSSNPPIMVFSPARRVRNNTTKHTLQNAESTREVVVNIVSHEIVQQCSLSSTEYGDGVNEFEKSGLTAIASETVKPFRVKESPVQFECQVNDIVSLGDDGGAGNLIICEVKLMHVNEKVLNNKGMIDMHKIDLVGRMGGNYYCRANGQALFEVEKPLSTLGIGVDQLPEPIRKSDYLTGNDLGKLGNVEHLPAEAEMEEFKKGPVYKRFLRETSDNLSLENVHLYAHELLKAEQVRDAWNLLMLHGSQK